MERFRHGQQLMNLKCPYSAEELLGFVEALIKQNRMTEALLRLTVSRGKGPRGYSPAGANEPTVVISLHPAPVIEGNGPPEWKLVTSPFRLPANEPLASFKSCNKLPQILARAAADAEGAQEALLLNTDNAIVEGASSNLFWVQNGVLCTPPLVSGILPGVTRAVIMELADKLGLAFRESSIQKAELGKMEGVFVSLSTVGIAARNIAGWRSVATL